MIKNLLASVLFLCTIVGGPSVAPLEAADTQDLKLFYQRVWSPYCKGNSLLECPSGSAEALREDLRVQFENGASFEELEAYLISKYGSQVKMLPESNRRGSLAYWIPWIAFLFVLWGLGLFWKDRVRRRKNSQTPDKNLSSANPVDKNSELELEIQERLL
jgi:cytochrome c-type biogenesis protein CcmH/NrfF